MNAMKKLIILAVPVFFVTTMLTMPSQNVKALSGSDWRAGRITDDAVFTDNSSMTPTQIQQFLDSKIPACDTHGTGTVTYSYGGGQVTTSRALYSYRRGNGAITVIKPDNIPDSDNSWYTDNTWFQCLNNYWENPSNGQNNYANRPIPAGGQSAAQLIWLAAQAHNISPKTLLVTLQKEQGLVTDTWPFQMQFIHALGAYCPDNPPSSWPNGCDPNHEGFSKQMDDGADLFRYYIDNMSQAWWSYKKPGINNILYSPTAGCPSSNVNIENKSTAALYTYTPYQPNQAALDNLYGSGDGCSAYGNRNFWRTFNDWFGSTYADAYTAQFNAQSSLIGEPFYPGESRQVFIQYKNLGSARWYDNSTAPTGISPVHLAATNPTNRKSVFSNGWPSDGRPNVTFSKVYEADGSTLASNQHVVEPGQIARFEFNITPPWNVNLGTTREFFQPVLEGASSWNMGGLSWLDITVDSRYKAASYSQSAFPTLAQNNAIDNAAFLQYKNTGSAAWYDDTSVPAGYYPTHLATTSPLNRWSGFGPSWPKSSRPNYTFSKVYASDGVTLSGNQHIVMPGQIGRYDFSLTASKDVSPGTYRESFQPVQEGYNYPIMGTPSWFDITVTPSVFSAGWNAQSSFPTLSPGESKLAFIQYKNLGSTRWYDDTSAPVGLSPVHLAASVPTNRKSVFSYGWPSSGRPNVTFTKVYEADGVTLAANQHVVEAGQIARFEFNITSPWNINTGTHREYFQPVLEGTNNWSMNGISWLDVTVR